MPNAFNTLNREACMGNIQHLCPAMSPIVINTYRQPAHLFVGGETILSSEGTTQGDPIAMPMYALGVLPLLKSVLHRVQSRSGLPTMQEPVES